MNSYGKREGSIMRSYRCDFYFRYFFYWWGNIAILTLLINQIFLLRAFYLFRAAIYVRKKNNG
jgi:hypothetical protein